MAKKVNRRYLSFMKGCFNWGEPIIIAYIVVVLVNMFMLRQFGVHQKSMLNTLQEGDHIMVSTMFYQPKVRDVIVIHQDGVESSIVKRVIATGRQTVDIKNGKVIVDGEAISEPYASNILGEDDSFYGMYSNTNYTIAADMELPCTVPEGKVFVLGDNRIKSKDSRYKEIGFIDERDIVGKVLFRIFPFDRFGIVK